QTLPGDVNTPPVAVADEYTVNTNRSLDVPATGVLANDSDAEDDTMTSTVVDGPANGTLTLNANGSFTYTPGAQFVGSDSFTYTASDGVATSNITTVTLLVEGNVFTVVEDSGAGTSVGTLRVDGLTDPLMFEIDDPSLPDELSLVPDDHLSGDPAASLVLIEYVDFQCSACAAFQPIVQDLETQFEDDLLVVQRYFPLTTTHDNALPAAWAAEAAGRQGKFNEMGDLLYQNQSQWKDESDPKPFFVDYATTLGLDLDQFASDMVDPVVDARVQRDLQAGESLGVQGTPTFFLNGDKLDLSGTSNELMSILSSALNDADNPFTVDRTTGEILVTGFTNLNFESTPKHELTVNVTDVDGNREQLDVVINVVDTPERPIAIGDAYEVDQEGALNVDATTGILSNDTDPDADSLVAILGTSTANGTLNFQSDGSFSYAPDSGFTGTDSFTYQASDGTLRSSTATVTLTVRDVNIAPVAVADAYDVDEDDVLTVDATNGVLVNDPDVDDDVLSAELLDQPSNGTVDLKPDGSFVYTPDDNFVGTDTFTYRASDGTLVSNTVTVTLTVVDVNQPPVAREDQYDVRAGQPSIVSKDDGLLNNDTDLDGGVLPALQVSRFGSPAHGAVSVAPDGSFTYTPDDNFVGTDTFTYRASDGQKESEETTVTLKVAADQVLTVVAGTADGTSVGQVAVEGSPTPPLLYEIIDPDSPDALQLAADDHLTGDPAAVAVWVQYVDFQHIAAQSLHQEVRKLEQEFADDLLVVTRYLPATGLNSNALKAAQAVEAAGRQGKFDAMVDHLFAVEHWNNAEEWRTAADPWPRFAQYAAEIGLGEPDAAAQFLADYNDSATLDRIQRDLDTANALGVTGTPAFYLNGQWVTSPWTFDAFKNRVEEQINGVNNPLTIDRRTGEIQVAKSSALDPAVNPVVILPVRVSDANGLFDTVYVQVDVVDSSTSAVAGDSTAATDAAFANEQDWRTP
ncbi:MAG: Ig-like domain-containing protein, partial [Pirellulales bacterium]